MPDTDPQEIPLPTTDRLRVSQDTLSVRELLALVQAGVTRWQQELQRADGVDRERAAAAIKDLSRTLDSLSQQLAQGRETVKITKRLPTLRAYSIACPVCGRGNRAAARFCQACGSPLPTKAAPQATTLAFDLNVAWRSDVGRTRANNEDTCIVRSLPLSATMTATILLVADGMGGAQAGEIASRLASTTVYEGLARGVADHTPASDSDWHTLLREAVVAANRRVYAQARTDTGKQGMGTTLTVGVAAGNRLHLAHVGDSRAYLMNANGVTDDGTPWMQLTSDHTLVARLVEIGQLTPDQAHTHAHRNMLYRSLGTDATIEVDTNSQSLNIGDTLVLCSDGLTTHATDNELASLVLDAARPELASDRLIALANMRGGQDNISVIVAQIKRG